MGKVVRQIHANVSPLTTSVSDGIFSSTQEPGRATSWQTPSPHCKPRPRMTSGTDSAFAHHTPDHDSLNSPIRLLHSGHSPNSDAFQNLWCDLSLRTESPPRRILHNTQLLSNRNLPSASNLCCQDDQAGSASFASELGVCPLFVPPGCCQCLAAAPGRAVPSRRRADTNVVSMANCAPRNTVNPSSRRLSMTSNAARSISRTNTFVVTRAPLHTCATSRRKPLRPGKWATLRPQKGFLSICHSWPDVLIQKLGLQAP